MSRSSGSAMIITKEFRELMADPIEGFVIELLEEGNIFDWEVVIFGPPRTMHAGGYYRALLQFPENYPFEPPSFHFIHKFWHPNVYDNGKLCMSILDLPTGDSQDADGKWTPDMNARRVLLSVLSLLNEPNIETPANVEAVALYQKWIDSNGEDNDYDLIMRNQACETRLQAIKDDVWIPNTVQEYLKTGLPRTPSLNEDQYLVPNCEDSDESYDLDETANTSGTSDSDKSAKE